MFKKSFAQSLYLIRHKQFQILRFVSVKPKIPSNEDNQKTEGMENNEKNLAKSSKL